jgi:C4-dicarboxylate-specific signal transduction histidine kinase
MIAIVCAAVVLLVLDFAQQLLLIGDLTRSVSRSVVWSALICFIAYLTIKSHVTSAVRRTLLVPLCGVILLLASDVAEDVKAWNDTPLIGRNSQVRRVIDKVAMAVTVSGIFLTLYQLLRSIDASHRKYQIHLDELAQASRISTMNEVTAGIAHELNQPLTAIAAYAHSVSAHLLSDSVDVTERATELLNKIEAQACRAGDIIKRLRQLVAPGELALDVVDFNDIVREAVEICGSRASELRQRIDFRVAVGLPRVRADVVQIQQLVVNLVVNALEANAVGNGCDNVVSVVTSFHDGEYVRVSVIDNGPGLPAETPSRVFEPFYSTKSHGMGIGLAICKSIAEAHHGQLTANDSNGHADRSGATFRLQLPVVRS